jgi:hypothetical protein
MLIGAADALFILCSNSTTEQIFGTISMAESNSDTWMLELIVLVYISSQLLCG